MTLFGDWLRRYRTRPRLSAGKAAAGPARAPRNSRADTISALYVEIARLQQERAAWGRAEDSRSSLAPQLGSDRQLADIERHLDQAQRDLARYQGRI